MAEEQDKKEEGQEKKEGGEEQKAPPKPTWPVEGRTVRLARDMLVIPVGEAERPWKVPPTISGHINIGMGLVVFVPDLDTQKAGFTPYKFEDGDPIDATRELLEVFRGIYIPFAELGK